MSDLLKEFEDDMRRERSEAMWKSFGTYVVWLSIAIVLGTAGGVSWRYWQKIQDEKETGQLMQGQELIEAGEYKRAIEQLDTLAKESSGSMRGLAMLHKAQAQSRLGDKEAAQKTYTALAEQGDKEDPYTVLALLLAADDAKLLPEPKKDQAFYYSQMEWRGWQLYQAGKKEEAVTAFNTIYDDTNAPHSMRNRMAESLQLIAPKELLPEEKTVTPDAK